jgi:hypothetical protein
MRFIGTKVHGVLDYMTGILLIAAPWLFSFYETDNARRLSIALGVGVILYSLLTDYELSLGKVISMRTHLMIDIAAGIFLIVMPFFLNFKSDATIPFVVIGMMEIGAGLLTKKHTAAEKGAHRGDGNYGRNTGVAH